MRRLCEWKATPYTRKVISAHTSSGPTPSIVPVKRLPKLLPERCLLLKEGGRVEQQAAD